MKVILLRGSSDRTKRAIRLIRLIAHYLLLYIRALLNFYLLNTTSLPFPLRSRLIVIPISLSALTRRVCLSVPLCASLSQCFDSNESNYYYLMLFESISHFVSFCVLTANCWKSCHWWPLSVTMRRIWPLMAHKKPTPGRVATLEESGPLERQFLSNSCSSEPFPLPLSFPTLIYGLELRLLLWRTVIEVVYAFHTFETLYCSVWISAEKASERAIVAHM